MQCHEQHAPSFTKILQFVLTLTFLKAFIKMLQLPFVSPTKLALQPMWMLQWNISSIALTCVLDQVLLKDYLASIALGFNGQTPIAPNPLNMFCLDKDWSSVLLT
jgi:hypothetical protein